VNRAALIRWVADRRLVLGLGLLAALPVIVAAGYALTDDWAPLGDDAYIGIRAYDVFTGRSPLVGQRSSGASGVLSDTAYSPGPLLFWLLAIPARLPDPMYMSLTTAAVNVASVMGAVALAYRRGGAALMLATAIAIPIMLASLPAETYADVWNSSAPILPLVLLVFLAWSVACGEYRLLPLAVAVASFAAQAHLTFVAPAIGVTLVALACAVVLGEARRWPRRWLLATLAVAAICWSAPLIDQAVNRPGNFVVLARSALSDEPTVGFSSAWKSVTHTIGVPPWWLEENRETLQRVEDLTTRPHPLSIVSAVLMLGALAAVAIVGWRRRSAELLAAGALGLTLSAASWAAASSTPIESFGTVGYTLRWTSAAGMCVWLLLGWSLVTVSGARARLPAYATAAAAGAAAVVALVVAIAENPPRREPYQPMRAIYDSLEERLPARGGTRVEVSSSGDTIGLGSELAVGIVYWLRRHGRSVVTSPEVADRLSSAYARGTYERVVHVFVDVDPDTGQAIARVPVLDPLDQTTNRSVTVTMTPTARRSARGSRAGSPPRRIAWTSRDSHAGTARHR
jgi:hypothetical protein